MDSVFITAKHLQAPNNIHDIKLTNISCWVILDQFSFGSWKLNININIIVFRQACIHAVEANPSSAQQEACDIATGYTALANSVLLPALLPPVCLKCTDADTPYAVGETVELKLPAKQADIVVVVETTKVRQL